MGKGSSTATTKGLKRVHTQTLSIAAWVTFVLAIADGALMPGTFVGDWTRSALNLMPTAWTVGVCLIGGAIGLVLGFWDVYQDLEPNQTAVGVAMFLPTFLSAISGGFADWIGTFSNWVLHQVDQWVAASVPNGLGVRSDLFIVAFAVVVFMLASRTNKKNRKG